VHYLPDNQLMFVWPRACEWLSFTR